MKTFCITALVVGTAAATNVNFAEERYRIDTRTDLQLYKGHAQNLPVNQESFNALNGNAAGTTTRRGGLPIAPAPLSPETLKLDVLKGLGARTCQTVTCKHEIHSCAGRTSASQADGVCGADENGVKHRFSSVRVLHNCVATKKTDAQMKARHCTEDICTTGHFCAMTRDSTCVCVERKPYAAIPGCLDQWGAECHECDVAGGYELDDDKSRCKLHGGWTDFSQWSTCSLSCGKGTQVRYRLCEKPAPAYGGNVCAGAEEEEQSCNEHSCPINGNWGGWGALEACTVTSCGLTGTQTKRRTCSDPTPAFGGKQCSTAIEDSANSDTSCATACCAGTFSATGTGQCQPWKTCAAGSGKSKEGTSTSDRECESCTAGAFFSTNNDGSACKAVRDACPAGTHIKAVATASSDMECRPNNKGKFTSSAGQDTDAAWRTCPAGSGMSKEGTASSDRECEACRLGYFFSNTNDGSACEAVRAPCPAGERIWAAATTSSNLECRPCGSGQFSDAPMQDQCNDWKKCASGKGEINTPSADTDRECGGCELGKTFSDALDGSACRETDECAGNEWEKVAATTESDRACATHADECASHEYQTQAPDGTQDRECAKKVCHCPNGVFADGDECPKHGDPMCLSCTGAFHLADANKQCQANTCYCVHGSVAFGSDCTTNGATKCMDCNEGYHIEGDNCVITPINGGWSDWSTPGACSVTACGQTGTRTKTRTCSNPAKANGGLDCVGSANDDSTACATAACPTTTTTTTTTTTPCAMVQCQAGWNLVGADERGCGGTCWFSTPDDLSTGQPCQASSETHGTTCALALNGDTRRDHPFQLHTAKGDQWVRVLLKASTTNPKVTFYARNCCSSNTGPTMRMFIGATDNLSAATDCGKITGIADSTTNVATCTGTGKFVWLRTDGAKTLQVPEFKVEGVPAMLIA